MILKLPVHDTEAGYKFFRRKKILPVLKQVKDKRWFWDTEIIALGYLNGLKIKEIKVLFKRRSDKTSTVNLFRDTLEYIWSLLVFRSQMRDRI